MGIHPTRLSNLSGMGREPFGISEDVPVAGDYDSDGKTDVGVFRPSNGNWYVLRSADGFAALNFGLSGDRPVTSD